MKLVFAIVQYEDGQKVMDELSRNGFSVTKVCSTGGFLKAGNTTLLVGVKENKVDSVIQIIEKTTKSRNKEIKTPAKQDASGVVVPASSMKVTVGSATVFVLDVERYEKV